MGIVYMLMGLLSGGFSMICGFDLKTSMMVGGFITIIYAGMDNIPWKKLKELNIKKYIGAALITSIIVCGILSIRGITNKNFTPLFLSGLEAVKLNGAKTVVPCDFDFKSPDGKMLRELSRVVGENGYGEFLVFGHLIIRGTEKYWIFNNGKELKLSRFSDNPLMFSNIIVRERGLWYKTKVAESRGHLVKAKWTVGNPSSGKVISLNAKHIWYKWF